MFIFGLEGDFTHIPEVTTEYSIMVILYYVLYNQYFVID